MNNISDIIKTLTNSDMTNLFVTIYTEVTKCEYLENVEARLNQNVKDPNNQVFNYKNLTKEEQELLNDLIFLIKEKFTEEKTKDTYYTVACPFPF